MRFGFADHLGPKIEAFKVTTNTTRLRFTTEYGFNTSQNGMSIYPTDQGPSIGINTEGYDANYRLAVNGKVRAREVKVDADNWPDYVFEDDYHLTSLDHVKTFIKENKHLPGMPKASVVAKEGIALGDINKRLSEKVEELTLHLSDKYEEISQLRKDQEDLKSVLKQLLSKIENPKNPK